MLVLPFILPGNEGSVEFTRTAIDCAAAEEPHPLTAYTEIIPLLVEGTRLILFPVE